jgi:hypothetical protein
MYFDGGEGVVQSTRDGTLKFMGFLIKVIPFPYFIPI